MASRAVMSAVRPLEKIADEGVSRTRRIYCFDLRRGEVEFLGWGAILGTSGPQRERDLGVRAAHNQRGERRCACKADGLGLIDDEQID